MMLGMHCGVQQGTWQRNITAITRGNISYRIFRDAQRLNTPAGGSPLRHCTATCDTRGPRRVRLRTSSTDAAGTADVVQNPPAGEEGVTLYIRTPLAKGQVVRHADGSICVFGDVPAGCVLEAGGDVVVMGRLEGEARAGGTPGAMVAAALGVGGSAIVSIAGVKASQLPTVGAARGVMAVLVPSPAPTEVIFKPLPGQAAGDASRAAGPGITSQLVPAAALALGVALIAAPSAILGGLVTTGGEGMVTALLETVLYGYILLQGAGLLSEGSELLLEVLDPGLIGGVLLPCLGALPDSLIVLNSGLKGSREVAQEQLAVGMGTLAGSTVLLLSLAWGLSVILGRCDLSDSTGRAMDKRLTRGFDLDKTGVTTDDDVRRGAAIMASSVMLYGIVQVPAFLGFQESPKAALTGAIACIASAVLYCAYSVLSPELQKRKIEAARKKRLRMYLVKALAERTVSAPRLGSLVDPYGQINRSTLRAVFDEFDSDGSGSIDAGEVQALLLGLQLGGSGLISVDKSTIDLWFQEMDVDSDSQITFDEFYQCLSRWVEEKISSAAQSSNGGGKTYSSMLDPRQGGASAALLAELPAEDLDQLRATAIAVEAEPADEAAEDMSGEGEGGEGPAVMTRSQILARAGAMLAGGVALCAVFSDPLVESLSSLSRASGIPAFAVGFVLTPLASNSSEFLSSLKFAARKRISNMSLTLAQVYGAVTLNNTLVLAIFLWVVYERRLPWVYSSEVTVIVVSTLIMGALGFSRSTFKTKWAIPAIALYPLSLLSVYLLDTKLGWQ